MIKDLRMSKLSRLVKKEKTEKSLGFEYDLDVEGFAGIKPEQEEEDLFGEKKPKGRSRKGVSSRLSYSQTNRSRSSQMSFGKEIPVLQRGESIESNLSITS